MSSGIGSWRNFDELEEFLILDELLLLIESLGKHRHESFKMAAAIQGIEIADYGSSEELTDDGGDEDEFPPELFEAELAWQKEKALHVHNDLSSFGIGVEVVK